MIPGRNCSLIPGNLFPQYEALSAANRVNVALELPDGGAEDPFRTSLMRWCPYGVPCTKLLPSDSVVIDVP